MNIEIRPALPSDLDAIIELIEQDAIGVESKPRDSYLRSFGEINSHPDNELIVATSSPLSRAGLETPRDGEVVGTLQLTFIPGLLWEWRAQVESVRVREDRRNLGIGSSLMNWAIARGRERGCGLLQLTTNAVRKDAQRFYQRLGFTASHIGMKLKL